ncbi:4Fe-4S single cluster domain-containing protein [Sorangium sp. So ce296]|uniref:4Fe-4S single cluster domain-containing protein n=1 Tax=Sorangium sp. So ce296 TaxID=3133296 RepID=UPI003F6376F3
MLLNLADAVAPSFANGPGARAVLWVQGCSIHCPGCHNPHTWSARPVRVCDTESVVRWYRSTPSLRGVTLSGGEPFEQARALAAVCRILRSDGSDVVAFSGYTREQLEDGVVPHSKLLLREVDLLIDGPYKAEEASRLTLRGSRNQRLHFLTDRIAPGDLDGIPSAEWIGRGERVRMTGFAISLLEGLWRGVVG